MARADDDSWDITKSVGVTALGIAYARAHESASELPLVIDPYAKQFIDAATALGWHPSMAMAQRFDRIAGYAAARTKWFDEFFLSAGAHGITQAVILAAGLDARAWRLRWTSDTTLYELDQPLVLQFKADTLRANDAQPATRYVPVAVDLRQDWPAALRDAGFDPGIPTAWSAEGLLPYLPAAGQDLLFERILALSARDSRIAVEAFGPAFFDPAYQAERREAVRKAREEAGEPDGPDVADLWYAEEREDVADYLARTGWETTTITAPDLMQRYHREVTEVTPRTEFVEGLLA